MPVLPADFKQAMARFLSGVTVVSAERDGQVFGMTASAFLSVSLDPPLVLVSVAKSATMHGVLLSASSFSFSILSVEQQALSSHFAGYGEATVQWVPGPFGPPVLAGALAWVGCSAFAAHDAGDHTLFIGRVESAQSFEGAPLAYFRGKYRTVSE